MYMKFHMLIKKERLYFTGKLNLVFHLNPEILANLFDLNYYLILTPSLTLTPQLSPNPNRKPHMKYAQMNISQCFFSLCNIIFTSEIVTS